MDFITSVKEKARRNPQRIVLPEGTEERTLKAADVILKEGIARVILLGDPERIAHLASEYYLEHIGMATIVDPKNNPDRQRYIDLMLKLRAAKGLTPDQAAALIEKPLYLGAVMVKAGDADGEVAGADSATSDVLRPAFQYVKTEPGVSVVSGAFQMTLPDKMFGENGQMVFADCAVTPCPTAEELAQIAVITGRTARRLCGFEPRVAMLSFSTMGSASHPMVDKVTEATRLARELDPTLEIDGDLQADAAIIPGVACKKAPRSRVAGRLQAGAAHGTCRGDRPDPAGSGLSDQRPFARLLGRRHRRRGRHHRLPGHAPPRRIQIK